MDYDTLNDVIDKYLCVTVKINKASDIPQKSANRTMVSYEWIDQTNHNSEEVEKSRAPVFKYSKDHVTKITSDLIEDLMLKTL